MSREPPLLDYETETVDGVEEAVYYHEESGETIVGNELGDVDDSDEWGMRWYCRRCGEIDPDENDLEPAGMTSIHVQCADDDELAQAETEENIVATNVQNAQSFDDGAFDEVNQ